MAANRGGEPIFGRLRIATPALTLGSSALIKDIIVFWCRCLGLQKMIPDYQEREVSR
jgi:hypothetical protein